MIRLMLTVLLLLSPAVAETWFVSTVLQRPGGFVTSQEWGSQPDSLPEEWRQTPTRIVIHHAGVNWVEGTDPYTKVRNLQAWGKREKGWPDLPYHFLISPDGRIFEGRDPSYQPQSNTDYEMKGVLNVQLFGNFEEQSVSPEQKQALISLLRYLCDSYSIPSERISTHQREAPGQTTCPGKDLVRCLPEILSGLN